MAVETQYARASDGTFVAYQVTGPGPIDMLIMRGWVTNIEHEWAEPTVARLYKRLAAGGRLIRLDRRGMSGNVILLRMALDHKARAHASKMRLASRGSSAKG